MRLRGSLAVVLILAWCVEGSQGFQKPGGVTEESGQRANPDALVLLDFKQRIDEYVALRRKVAKQVTPLKKTDDPAAIGAAQASLAAGIRAARANAGHGDIFTPAIRDRFRRLLSPEMKGRDGRDARAFMKEDAPPPATIPLKVNAAYPEGQPLPGVPANVLASLPTLPEEVEYRIVGRHLILRDVQANIIVDYIANVLPS